MNDFTKEELQELLSLIHGESGDLTIFQSATLALKINTMIDNYCEHEKVNRDYGSIMECEKCGKPLTYFQPPNVRPFK